jgi:hypothetical protein
MYYSDYVLQGQSWNAEDFTPSELGFAKTIANLVQQKYDLVSKDLQDHEQRRKVLAGILIRSCDKVFLFDLMLLPWSYIFCWV